MNKILLIAFFSTLIIGCGSDSGGSGSSDDISLSDIHGLWEATNTNDYDFTFVDKDDLSIYFGSYNASSDCYVELDDDTFTFKDGKIITDGEVYTLDLDGDSLTVTSGGEVFTYDYVQQNLTEDDIC